MGSFLGWLTVVMYVATIFNYLVKVVNKRLISKENKKVRKVYSIFMRVIIKGHKIFGLTTVILIISHFILQFSIFGTNISGMIAATTMGGQVALGAYGAYVDRKRIGLWFKLHRVIAIVLLISLFIHVILKVG